MGSSWRKQGRSRRPLCAGRLGLTIGTRTRSSSTGSLVRPPITLRTALHCYRALLPHLTVDADVPDSDDDDDANETGGNDDDAGTGGHCSRCHFVDTPESAALREKLDTLLAYKVKAEARSRKLSDKGAKEDLIDAIVVFDFGGGRDAAEAQAAGAAKRAAEKEAAKQEARQKELAGREEEQREQERAFLGRAGGGSNRPRVAFQCTSVPPYLVALLFMVALFD